MGKKVRAKPAFYSPGKVSQDIYPEVEKVRGLCWTSDARVQSKVSGGFIWDFTNSCLPHSSRTPEVLQAFSDWTR